MYRNEPLDVEEEWGPTRALASAVFRWPHSALPEQRAGIHSSFHVPKILVEIRGMLRPFRRVATKSVVLLCFLAVACTQSDGNGSDSVASKPSQTDSYSGDVGPSESASAPPRDPQVRVSDIPSAVRTFYKNVENSPIGALDELNLTDASRAESLERSPIPRAVLVAQLLPGVTVPNGDTIEPGRPFLLTEGGDWRSVDLASYGINMSQASETQTRLSADGRKLLLGSRSPAQLIIVTLSTGNVLTLPVPVKDAVSINWSRDQKSISFIDRGDSEQGYVLDVETGLSEGVDFDAARSDFLSDGRVVETSLVRDSQGVSGFLNIFDEAAVTMQPLNMPSFVGRSLTASSLVSWEYRGTGADVGRSVIVSVDPNDGALVGGLLRTDAPRYWYSQPEWTGPRELTFHDFDSNAFLTWNIDSRTVRQVGSISTPNTVVSFAPIAFGRVAGP